MITTMSKWKLKRTKQCAKCPWRKDVDPRDVPNGYCEVKHANLNRTIAVPGVLQSGETLPVMACHETHDAHCIGWLAQQVGPGNNLPLRIQLLSCENRDKIKLVGEQLDRFEDTLPKRKEEG
jgi:hypothetical protein